MTTAPTSTTTAAGPPYEVIVVGNGSTDESLDWLRSMDWITLVDRGESTPENWIRAVTSAFDIGLDRAHAFRKTRRRLKRLFHRDDVDALPADDSLETDPGASS